MLTFERDEQIAEVDPAGEESEDRGEHILDQATDDAGERRADNDADGKIDDVAAEDESFEFADPSWWGR